MLASLNVLKRMCRQKPVLNICNYSESIHPFFKTINVLTKDIPNFFGVNKRPSFYPEHADIVIIGGGLIGSSIAFWLKTKAGEGLNVVVLEKDPSFEGMQLNETLGTITQHYSLPENMQLSLFGADFLRNVKEHLGKHVNIQYSPHGHLVLASEQFAEKLERNVILQKEHGVKNEILTVEDIKERFPWMNTDDIKLGSMGTESEGVFNARELHQGLINKSQELGAKYIKAEVVGFELEQMRDVLMEGVTPGTFKKIKKVIYRTLEGEHAIQFAGCILAAGHNSGEIAKLAKIGTGEGLLAVPLPIESKQQKVYSVKNIGQITGLNTPLVTDTTGLWLMRRGLENSLLCGHVFLKSFNIKDPLGEEFRNKVVIPSLQNRIPECKVPELTDETIELYDFNKFDETGILGPHPYHNNLYLAVGFGRNACAHAPGIGRAISELIIDSNFTTIDLTRFTFDRIFTDRPMIELNVY